MMKKLRHFVTAVLAAACVCGLISETASAAADTTITGVTELREWYEKRGAVSATLKDNLIIRNSVTLNADSTSWKKELDMDEYYIHIMSGGSLTINNKDFLLTSEEERVIVVEPGGKLYLRYGTIKGTEDEVVIILKTGAIFNMSAANFDLTGEYRFISSGESQGSSENSQPQLLSVDEESLSLACVEGASVSSLPLPAAVKVSYLTAEGEMAQMTLPISWDFSPVDLETSGVYKVKGTFTEETLKSHSLTNPGQVSASLLLAVMKKEDAGTLNVRMLNLDSEGNTVVRLEFPMLTTDVTALYLYSSTDGEHFRRESWTQPSGGGAVSETDNFLAKSAGKVDPPWQYLEYSHRSNGPFWLQLEVVGSALAGRSNIVECDSLEEREPRRIKGNGGGENGSSDAGSASGAFSGAEAADGFGGNGALGNLSGGAGGENGGADSNSLSGGNSFSGSPLSESGEAFGESGLTGKAGRDLTGNSGNGSGGGGADGLPGDGMDGNESMLGGMPEDGMSGDEFSGGMDGSDPSAGDGSGNPGWKGVTAAAAAVALILAAAAAVWKFRKRRDE